MKGNKKHLSVRYSQIYNARCWYVYYINTYVLHQYISTCVIVGNMMNLQH